MQPVSLLFSSDEEMSRRLVQALEELELAIEPCPDVFVAVEWLISRSFDVIVADCDSGPEAAFLLKNARELKLNKAAFTLALTSGSSNLTLEEDGADLVLTKPLTSDEIKYALLANDRFLTCMKSWISRGDMAQAPEPSATSPALPIALPDPPSPVRLGRTAESGLSSNAKLGDAKATRNRNKFLGVVLGVVFLCAGYVCAGRPALIQGTFARAATAYRQTLAKAFKNNSEEDDNSRPNFPTVADISSETRVATRSAASRVRVVPLHPIPVSAPAPVASAKAPDSDVDQDQLAAADTRVQIPESLRAPPSDAAIRTVSVKRPVSLLGQMEPVTLSERTAEELLLEKVPPSYPAQALKAGLQGPVVLQAWIGKDGSIQDLKLVNGSFLLAQAAVDAVKQWRYKPYVRNGVAVEAETYVTVNFTLP
jgi:TonB family protein